MKRHSQLASSLFILLLASAACADGAWKAGLARQNVTPQERIYLAGYASRNKPFESVADDLYVKALALEDAAGYRAVLLTSDLIGFRASFAEEVADRIGQKAGLDRAQILLNSSHTHTGPLLSLDLDYRAREMTAEQAQATVAYTRQLVEQTVAAALEALGDLQPARLSFGRGVAGFVMNRREPTRQGIRLGVNPTGLADRAVPLMRVDDPAGNLRAVLYGAAAHNTTLTGRHYVVSGDYAGLSQRYIEKQYPGVQAMFMLGCAGSANPYPRGDMKYARQHGEELGAEVCRLLDGELSAVEGPLRCVYEAARLPLQRPLTEQELAALAESPMGWQPWVARQMKAALEERGELPATYPCPTAVWQFGDDLTLVGLSGEVVVDYVPLIERALGPLDLWIAAYCNDVFGYVPSTQVLADGGYETRGLIYGGVGFFAPEAERVLVDKVRQLAEKAGRPATGGE